MAVATSRASENLESTSGIARGRSSRDERRLIKAAQRGSTEAINGLVERYWDQAQRTAYLIVVDLGASEDIAQEAMLKALESLDGFNPRRPFGPWLHRIVVNRALDWLRARARRPVVSTEAVTDTPAAAPGASDPDLMEAIGTLGPDHRSVVALRFLLGYSIAEIASILDLPRGTVGSRLRRALDQLELQLTETMG